MGLGIDREMNPRPSDCIFLKISLMYLPRYLEVGFHHRHDCSHIPELTACFAPMNLAPCPLESVTY